MGDLKETLNSLKGFVKSLPLAIVTPSASGKAIKDWLDNGGEDMDSYIKYWIPVASNSLFKASSDSLNLLKDMEIKILAIHGSLDEQGAKTGSKLEKEGGAEVLEIYGKHPCYLDSPDEF